MRENGISSHSSKMYIWMNGFGIALKLNSRMGLKKSSNSEKLPDRRFKNRKKMIVFFV